MRIFSALFSLALTGLLSVSAYSQMLASFNDDGLTYGHVHLNVSDMDRHIQILEDHFGGRTVRKGHNANWDPMLTAIVLNNTLVALSPSDDITFVIDTSSGRPKKLFRFAPAWSSKQ